MKIQNNKYLGAAILSLVLAACGGGGSSGGGATTPPVTTTAEGVYGGTLSNGNSFDGIVLEDGSYYVLSGAGTTTGLTVTSFSQGNSTSNNGSFSSTNLLDFLSTNTVVAGSISASYSASSLSGSVTVGGVANTFTGTTPANTSYVYGTVAKLSDIAGAWTLSDMKGGAITATIATTGAFTGTSSTGCAISGTFVPRASGKNVFNFSGTYGAAPCVIPGGIFSGIAIDYLLTNGTRQFIAAGVDAGRTAGTSVFGVR